MALHAFNVPLETRIAISPRKVNSKLNLIISQSLSHTWYRKKLGTLLHIEELKQQKDMDAYAIKGAKLVSKGRFLSLDVPSLAEKRPSLLRGDRLYALSSDMMKFGGSYFRRFEGFIHDVQQTKICICFNEMLHSVFIKGTKLNIEFTLNRHALKMMHRGLQLVWKRERSRDLLFPDLAGSFVAHQRSVETSIVMRNRDIEGNEKQSSAVRNIISPHAPTVYIVYGPPGTGKTVTMVEAIHQTISANVGYRILVCAPSNSACDLLTCRLMEHIDKKDILRMHAASRKGIPGNIKDVSNCHGDHIYFPEEVKLREYRVIVCTLITAGRLASAEGIFHRIFVDESGQALEPELMVAIGGNLVRDGKVVLAGDPKQLGPIIRSSVASTNGLQISYLERLMGRAVYQKDLKGEYNSCYVTKLLKNYRSHESIIKIPNDEFYDGELEVCADEMKRNIYCDWSELPKKDFPVVFEAVFGQDNQDKDSPSFHNTEEVKVVKRYVDTLLQDRRHRIRPAEIGIITPYRKQVKKMRDAIRNEDIKVGSVEEFQGQERRVIILSTVRSNEKYLDLDKKYALGFLSNPKRFNVAITRAQALLIIIGNPKLLCRDQYWRKMIKYCYDNKSCIGMKWEDVEDLSTLEETEVDREDGDEDADDRIYGDWRLDP